MCVCVCVREREREGETERDRGREYCACVEVVVRAWETRGNMSDSVDLWLFAHVEIWVRMASIGKHESFFLEYHGLTTTRSRTT